MALGTRELLLVIRARDEATRVLGRLSNTLRDLDKGAAQAASDAMNRGGALVSLGAGIASVGAAGAALLYDMTEAAVEYEHAASRALTQTGDIEASLEDLKRIGRDVARDIPAPFEQMQDALFTVFSTIETDVPGAEAVLRNLAKSAVAGQTDLQATTEGTLQVLNGFSLGVEEIGRVSDVMFELVAEGVGSFEEFVTNIGKATPSAQRMGQSVEGLGGMMAFMTRNGLSGAMAATSAARAFDLMANQKVIDRMKDFGVSVTDAQGQFRPMADIVSDLARRMEGLTAPERAAALTNLFQGSGNNVQARRFFDLAIPGFQQLNDLTGEMQNSSGAMERAYDIMLRSPQTQTEELNNRFKIMRTEIGERLIPAKLWLLQVLSDLLGLWESIPGPVQTAIIMFVAVTSGLLVLAGVVTIIAGAFLILQGALILAGTTFGAVAASVGIILVVFAAIGAAVYLVIKYWDDIKAATETAWQFISAFIQEHFGGLIDTIVDNITTIVDAVLGWWDEFVSLFERGIARIQEEWAKWSELIQPVTDAAQRVGGWIKWLFDLILPIVQWGLNFMVGMFLSFAGPIVDGIQMAFGAIWKIIAGVMEIIRGIIMTVTSLIMGDWSGAWEGIKTIFSGIWAVIWGAIEAAFGLLWSAFNGLLFGRILGVLGRFIGSIIKWGGDLMVGLVNGIRGALGWLDDLLGGIPSRIGSFFSGAISWLYNAGKDLLTGIWNGINGAASWLKEKVMGWAGSILPGWVKDILGISSPSKVFAEIGVMTMQGFAVGFDRGAVTAVESALNAATAVSDAFNTNLGLDDAAFSDYAAAYIGAGAPGTAAAAAAAAGVTTGTEPAGRTVEVPVTIFTQEINPVQHSTELGMLIAETVA
jgi:TP901 family phage tail tape measure protein